MTKRSVQQCEEKKNHSSFYDKKCDLIIQFKNRFKNCNKGYKGVIKIALSDKVSLSKMKAVISTTYSYLNFTVTCQASMEESLHNRNVRIFELGVLPDEGNLDAPGSIFKSGRQNERVEP